MFAGAAVPDSGASSKMLSSRKKSSRGAGGGASSGAAAGTVSTRPRLYTAMAATGTFMNILTCGAFGLIAHAYTGGGVGSRGMGRVGDDVRESSASIDSATLLVDAAVARTAAKVDELNIKIKEKLAQKDRKGAAILVKRKLMLLKSKANREATSSNLETTKETMENIAVDREVFEVYKQNGKAMKNSLMQMSPKDVGDTMVEMQENMDDYNEIQQELTQQLNPGGSGAIDETDVDRELDEIEQEMIDSKLNAAPDVPAPAPVSSRLEEAAIFGGANIPVAVASSRPAPVAAASGTDNLSRLKTAILSGSTN